MDGERSVPRCRAPISLGVPKSLGAWSRFSAATVNVQRAGLTKVRSNGCFSSVTVETTA